MDINEFNELIENRQQFVNSYKVNNFDIDSILAGMYNDPSHFIYEILQNAEDASASEITFTLYDDRLEIKHNGKEFDFKDVDGITGIGISTKQDDLNFIGKFGVGFKSVFAITETPKIHSGNYHFEINNFVLPSKIEDSYSKETLIILPFNHPKRLADEVFNNVSKKLESIGLKTLLFLKNLFEIKWLTPINNGHYYKESKSYPNFENVHKVSIIAKTNENEEFQEYLVIKKPVIIENFDLFVEIAYKMGTDDIGKEILEKDENTKLIVFFPTEKETFLNFLIHAPYKTTPNRENIPLNDEQNKVFIEETSTLVADSISIIKDLGFLNVSFLDILPIEFPYGKDIIYKSIYEKVLEKFNSQEKLLPTSKQQYTTAKDALLARGKTLTEDIDEKDIKMLFGKSDWLHTNITPDRNRIVHNFVVKNLKIKEVDFEEFAKAITIEFLEKKNDDWLLDFYIKLLDYRSLWSSTGGILKKRPIMRLSDNSHISPYDVNNKIQVYLPSETKSKYKTIKRIFTEDDKSLKFLEELGLSKPDIFAEISEFVIPKYKKNYPYVTTEEYFDDIEKLLLAFKQEGTKRNQIFNELKELYVILATNSDSGIKGFYQPKDTYYGSEELLEYFKDFEKVLFISEDLFKIFENDHDILVEFLLFVGCKDNPRRKIISPILSEKEKTALRMKQCPSDHKKTTDLYSIDYNYEGLDNFLKDKTEKRAIILWNLLLKSIRSYVYFKKENFFNGEYKWKYRYDRTAYFESRFLKTLKTTPWVVDTQGNFVLPSQICISELSDSFSKEDENVELLRSVLGFQLDEIKQIEEKTGGKFIDKDEYENFKLWKEQGKKKSENIKNYNKWEQKVEPDSIKTEVKEFEPETLKTPNLRGQRQSDNTSDYKNESADSTEKYENNIEKSNTQPIEIGKWGEKFVYHTLQNEFNKGNFEIIWLNENQDFGKGYDLLIKSNGIETEYVEVKSTTSNNQDYFEITGTQWEFARTLYNDEEGDKYKIYLVKNAGTEEAEIIKISNPIKLWYEGRLFAHPVRLRL